LITQKLVIANADEYEYEHFDVAILFLVLQFLDIGKRKSLLQKLIEKVRPGGAVIIFDKMIVEGGYISTVLRRATIAGKASSGTPADEIVAKELSLGGIQRPLPEKFFDHQVPGNVKEIFRFGEFAGFLIERPQ
jgi:tRNA (cmo5U34)-methyltransferase